MNNTSLSNWLNSPFHSVSVVDTPEGPQLNKDNFWSWLGRKISYRVNKEQIQRVAQVLGDRLEQLAAQPNPSIENSEELAAAKAFIQKHRRTMKPDFGITALDRRVATVQLQHGLGGDLFGMECNRFLMQRWERLGFDRAIYVNHPQFVEFMINSHLAHNLRVTRDSIVWANGEPGITVEGVATPWSQLQARFEIKKSRNYNAIFVNERTTNRVFSYLDTGEGLVPHNPYLFHHFRPTSTLTPAEMERVREAAERYVRPDEIHLTEAQRQVRNAERTHTIQICSAYRTEGDPNHPVVGPLNELIRNRKHMWGRYIEPNGNVTSVGYGVRKWGLPAQNTRGQMRSPDIYEPLRNDREIITNIPATAEEVERFKAWHMRHANDGNNFGNWTVFSGLWNNCARSITGAMQTSIGHAPDSYLTLRELVRRVAPPALQRVGAFFSRVGQVVMRPLRVVGRILPNCVKNAVVLVARKIKELVSRFFAFLGSSILLALGAAFGERGRELNAEDPNRTASAPLQQIENWANPQLYGFYSPGIIQEWQRQQPSTVIFENPVQMSIVPEGRD